MFPTAVASLIALVLPLLICAVAVWGIMSLVRTTNAVKVTIEAGDTGGAMFFGGGHHCAPGDVSGGCDAGGGGSGE